MEVRDLKTRSGADRGVTPRLVLASASPRRIELLRGRGYEFVVEPSSINEERADPGEMFSPVERAERLSHLKAADVAAKVRTGWLLAGDTIAALGTRIFGKPAGREDARRILTSLMGTVHEVITGVALLRAEDGWFETGSAVTRVTMRRLSVSELESYLAGGQWIGKAGAYGIQDRDDPFVESIDGSFSNVVGLPLELVEPLLARHGIVPTVSPR